MKLHFPHISRIISAALWLLLFYLAGHNAVAVTGRASHERERQVLGAQSPPATDKSYWEQIARDYPDYRDSYVQLAAVSYGQYNLPQAKSYLEKARLLDPNNQTVNALADFVSGIPQ